MKKYKVAFAGLVHDHIWWYIPQWRALSAVELVAAADPSPSLLRRARSEGVARAYRSWGEMLEKEEIDILEVATTNARAADVVEAAARRGIHVKVEKPMAARLRQADRMLAAARKAGVRLMVNWPTAWDGAIRTALEMVRRGEIGKPYYFRLRCAHRGPKEIGCSRYFWKWLYDEKENGAGALMDYCCYGADMCSWLFGLPRSVVGARAVLAKRYPVPDDNAVILMKYDGLFALAEASWTEQVEPRQPNPLCLGSKGNVGVLEGKVLFEPKGGRRRLLKPRALPRGERNGPEYFLSRIRRGKPIEGLVNAEVSRDAQEILEAGLLSADKGREIPLPLKRR